MIRRRLEGRVVVMAGALGGASQAIARAFGVEGAKVALIAHGANGLEAAARDLRAWGAQVLVFVTDVSDAAAVDDAARRVVAAWGAIDIWVNDATVSASAPVSEMTAQDSEHAMAMSELGYVHGTLAALEAMRPRNAGVIIQIGTALADRSTALPLAYCASNGAIRRFTESLRSELVREGTGIAVAILQLPAVHTLQFQVARNRRLKPLQPVPAMAEPDVIAEAVVLTALRPERELWIEWSATKAMIAQRVAPSFSDRPFATHAWEPQYRDRSSARHLARYATDNVDRPRAGDRRAHDPSCARARAASATRWVRRAIDSVHSGLHGVMRSLSRPMRRALRP